MFKFSARKNGRELAQLLGSYEKPANVSPEAAEQKRAKTEAETLRLVNAGAQVNTFDTRGFTPLMEAAYKGLNTLIQPLISAGADLAATSNERSMIPGLTPLMWAAYAGNAEGVKTLLADGADFRAKGFQDQTALHFAARSSTDAVRMLIEAGADVNALADDGRSPLFEAALHPQNVKTVQLLLDAGAQLNVQNKWSRWGLMEAATAHGGRDNPVAKLLREAFAKRAAAKTETPAEKPTATPVATPAATPAVPPPPKAG
jgi:ankyrin repeat protein